MICVGGAGNSFVDVHVDLASYTHLASIHPSNLTGQQQLNVKSKPKHFCHVYKSSSPSTTTLICLLKYHVEPKDAISWASLVSMEVFACIFYEELQLKRVPF